MAPYLKFPTNPLRPVQAQMVNHIQAYPDRLSYFPGEKLILHVSTDQPGFRVVVYRQGATLGQIKDYGWQQSMHQGFQAGRFDQDWNWDSYEYDIPPDWTSGVYIAMLFERDKNGTEIPPDKGDGVSDGAYGKALFVLKSATPGLTSPILYKVPIATYHAYNFSGGGSLYTGNQTVTMHRPGGGTGGEATSFGKQPGLTDDEDFYDRKSTLTTFEHYNAKFIRWLESNGFIVDYCADLDLHEDTDLKLLAPYALLLSVGHDEYWSPDMRDNVEAYIRQGGNVGFFSGNTCWWRTHYSPDKTSFTCDRSNQYKDARSDQWYITAKYDQAVKPENTLTGVSYRNGGGAWTGEREAVGYYVQNAKHWAYEDTKLQEGDTFGQNEHLLGYECDGADFDGFDCDKMTGFATPTHNDGTPPGFSIIGIGCLHQGGWDDLEGNHTATMVVREPDLNNKGTVFNAATTDWSRVLEAGEPRVDQITRNVIKRLGSPRGLANLSQFNGIIAEDGFFSPDDGYRHAIVATKDGNISEVFFNPHVGQGKEVLRNDGLGGIVDLAAFFTDDDNYRHVIVASEGGKVSEIFFRPDLGQGIALLGNFNGIVAVAGFFSPDDKYRHAIVATADGNIYELFYNPDLGQGKALLGNFPGIVDIAGFFSEDDGFRHVIVVTDDGYVRELFYHPQFGSGVSFLSRFDEIVKVSAFYVTNDARFNRRVVVATSDGRLHEIKFSLKNPVINSVLANPGKIADIGSFFSSDDGFRHVIIATDGGAVQELFYK